MRTKSEARREADAVRQSMTYDYKVKASGKICRKTAALAEFQRCRNLFIYVSVEGEPDTEEIIRTALRCGKKVYVPRCIGPGIMEAAEIEDFDEDLAPGAMGIPEPKAGRIADPSEIDLAVIPCVAAAPDGRRLGHGGGYYDRYLSKTDCVKVVLCFSCLLTDEIPVDPHDVKADRVITDAE